MKLYLVQHGDALPKSVDPERPLSESGRRDVERLASFLSRRGVLVSRILHSGKRRARETAELLASALPSGGQPEAASHLDPLDSPEPLAKQLEQQSEELLVVGHMPFVDKLVSRLVLGREDSSLVTFVPGALVCLARGGEGAWTVVTMLRPDFRPD